MKYFSRVALVVAMTASASSAFAMQAMTESDMSATTGQDGITVQINPNSSLNDGIIHIDNVVWHDKDGLKDAPGFTEIEGGAVYLGKGDGTGTAFSIQAGANGIKAIIDADGGNAGGTLPVLNINLDMGDAVIHTGTIWVGSSEREALAVGTFSDATKKTYKTTTGMAKIADDMTLNLTGLKTNIQLGNAIADSDGIKSMMRMKSTMANGFQIENLNISDADGYVPLALAGDKINIGRLTITDKGQTSLAMDTSIDITTSGLVISNNSLQGTDIVMEDVRLGNSANVAGSIGDIAMLGVDSVGTAIIISGH